MSRLFRRGELKAAVLEVVAEHGPTHGYAVLNALGDAMGSSWRPSPGSVYPALLALEDLGLIAAVDGDDSRIYTITPTGRAAVLERRGVLESVRIRADQRLPTTTLGQLLDSFASGNPARSTTLDLRAAEAVNNVLEDASERLSSVVSDLQTSAQR